MARQGRYARLMAAQAESATPSSDDALARDDDLVISGTAEPASAAEATAPASELGWLRAIPILSRMGSPVPRRTEA